MHNCGVAQQQRLQPSRVCIARPVQQVLVLNMFWQLHKRHAAVGILPIPNPDVKLRVGCHVHIPHDVPVPCVDVTSKEELANFLTPRHCACCLSKKVLLLVPPWSAGLVPVCKGMIGVKQHMVMPPLLRLHASQLSQTPTEHVAASVYTQDIRVWKSDVYTGYRLCVSCEYTQM